VANLEKYVDSEKHEPHDTLSSKVMRELHLASIAAMATPKAAADQIEQHPIETAAKVLAAAGLTIGLDYAAGRAGPVGNIARSVGIGLGVSAVGDAVHNVTPAMKAFSNSWQSDATFSDDAETMRTRFAPFLADSAMTITASLAGGRAGTLLQGRRPLEPTIPKFTDRGFLPEGVHNTTWQEFATRYGTNERRSDLLQNMEWLMRQARKEGATEVFVGGSFVRDKELPHDFDMTWRVEPQRVAELDKANSVVTNREWQQKHLKGDLIPSNPAHATDDMVGWFQTNSRYEEIKKLGVVGIDLRTLPSTPNYFMRTLVGKAGIKEVPDIAKTEPLVRLPDKNPYELSAQ
jgi:hypothetical protein